MMISVGRQVDALTIIVIALVPFVIAMAIVVIYDSQRKGKKENQAGKVIVPSVAQHEDTPKGEFMEMIMHESSTIPAGVYAALNYTGSQIMRVKATSEMITVLTPYFDNTKVQANIGEDAVFYLRNPVSEKLMREFNGRAMAAVDSLRRPQLVTVYEHNNLNEFKVYAFLDTGIKWDGEVTDMCEDDANVCTKICLYTAKNQ